MDFRLSIELRGNATNVVHDCICTLIQSGLLFNWPKNCYEPCLDFVGRVPIYSPISQLC